MTPVPPPASPCVRVRLDYTQVDSFDAGSRFFLSYAGSSPTAANCAALATAIAALWTTDLAPVIHENFSLTEVDVLDITTDLGASGVWNGTNPGTGGGNPPAAQMATNVEFNIGRRYRGGKPRMFLPPRSTQDLQNMGKWSVAFIGEVNTAMASFFTGIAGTDIGAMGALAHVNLSYFQGFKNITNSSGRERAVPQYRDTALVDNILGYSCKATVGSQRRRRTATTF